MQPSGTVGLIGFATNAMFLRDALDKAGIEAQFIARGEYKSAANLFTQDRYTEAHREADTRLLESLHAQVWQAVADSRKIGHDALDALADRAPLLREDAVTSGLIDRIGFRDEAYARIAELVGAEGFHPKPAMPTPTTHRRGCTCRRYARATGPGGPVVAVGAGAQTQADHRRRHPCGSDRQRPRRSRSTAVRQLQRRRRHHRGGPAGGGRR